LDGVRYFCFDVYEGFSVVPFLRPVQYHLSRFHPKQERAWLAYKAGLDIVLPWGRRSGKSELCIEIMIEDMEDFGKPCLYVAKTQKQARKIIWPKLKSRIKGLPDWKLRESTMEAEHIPSGSTISIYGADLVPDNMTGSGYRVIVCDEFALWKKPEIVGTVLSPMLGDFPGQIIFISTKRGKNHFYLLEKRAKATPQKYYTDEATIFDNTFLSDEGRAKVLSEYEGGEKNPLYRQEINNEYVVFEGMAFALAQEDYTEKRWDSADLDWSYHWRGVDHGFSPDPTACVWIAYNRRKKYFQVYNEYKQTELLIRQHADVIRGLEGYKTEDSFSDVDPQIIAEYIDIGLALTPAARADKQARILRIVNALQTGKLKIASNCKKLLDEMASYEWEQDGNDHLIDALNYGFTNLVIPQEKEIDSTRELLTPRKQTESNYQDFGD